MLLHINRRGQSIAEYALVLALVVGLVLALQAYVRTNLQYKIKQTVDAVGTGGVVPAVTDVTLGNPSGEDIREMEIDFAIASYSETPRKSKSLEEREELPGGEATITSTEISEVKDAVRKSLY